MSRTSCVRRLESANHQTTEKKQADHNQRKNTSITHAQPEFSNTLSHSKIAKRTDFRKK